MGLPGLPGLVICGRDPGDGVCVFFNAICPGVCVSPGLCHPRLLFSLTITGAMCDFFGTYYNGDPLPAAMQTFMENLLLEVHNSRIRAQDMDKMLAKMIEHQQRAVRATDNSFRRLHHKFDTLAREYEEVITFRSRRSNPKLFCSQHGSVRNFSQHEVAVAKKKAAMWRDEHAQVRSPVPRVCFSSPRVLSVCLHCLLACLLICLLVCVCSSVLQAVFACPIVCLLA